MWNGRKAPSILLRLTPRRCQAIKRPNKGTAQIAVNASEITTGGRGSGSRKVCWIAGKGAY